MPWQLEAMKGVLICDKRWSVDKKHDEPAIPEWGNPTT